MNQNAKTPGPAPSGGAVEFNRLTSVVLHLVQADPRLVLKTQRHRLRLLTAMWDCTYTPERTGRALSELRDRHRDGTVQVAGFDHDHGQPLPLPPTDEACQHAFEQILAVLGWQRKPIHVLEAHYRTLLSLMQVAVTTPTTPKAHALSSTAQEPVGSPTAAPVQTRVAAASTPPASARRPGVLALPPGARALTGPLLKITPPSAVQQLGRLTSVVYYLLEADPRLRFPSQRQRLQLLVSAWDSAYEPFRVGRAVVRLRDAHRDGTLHLTAFARTRDDPFPAAPDDARCQWAFEHILDVLGRKGEPQKVRERRWRTLQTLLQVPVVPL